jgi:hypothetical protein
VPRPSKFVRARKERLLAVLAAGGSRRQAAAVAGIDPKTLRTWLRRGEQGHPEGRWCRFYEDVLQAEADPRPRALPDPDDDSFDGDPWLAMRYLETHEPAFAMPSDEEDD